MVRCPNCGQETSGDSCQWCQYPLLRGRLVRRRRVRRKPEEARQSKEAEKQAQKEARLASEAEAIVLSAGWDAHAEDPLSKLDVTSDAFRRLGRIYGEVPLPTVIVQEGGYSLAAIESVAPRFVTEFLDERKP